jgi:hypothetical protein
MKMASFLAFLSTLAHADIRGLGGPVDVADPPAIVRSPNSGLSINSIKYAGKSTWCLETTLGKNFPLLTVSVDDLSLQLTIKAGAWLKLGYDDGAFPLLTEDFLIAVPISVKYRSWSGYIAFNHISAHLGDGFNSMMEDEASKKTRRETEKYEDLASNSIGYDVELLLRKPFPYSRDFISALVMCEIDLRGVKSKIYATAGYAHKMIPKHLGRWYVGGGVDLSKELQDFKPYVSQDLRYNADTDTVDYSIQVGNHFDMGYDFQSRIYLGMYKGSDRRGQLLGEYSTTFNFGLAVE